MTNDSMMTKKISGMEVGDVFRMNCGDDAVIIDMINAHNVRICFLKAIHEMNVTASEIRKRSVKNPLYPSVSGIGYIGIGRHKVFHNNEVSKTYSIWMAILQRTYNPSNTSLARRYKGCSVHTHWQNFQNFADWYEEQMNSFDDVNFCWELDKDLLVPGNRVYGPETCCVIPHQINVLFTDSAIARGNLPLGVKKEGNTFRARVGMFGKSKNLGSFNTVRDAQIAYWNAKFNIIQTAAILYWNYLPEPLAMRLLNFGWEDAFAYYGDDARLWSDNTGENNAAL